MDLQLTPTHADRAGGLGFLEIAHLCFGLLRYGSLADMDNSYRFVADMGFTACSRRALGLMAICAALPFVPLLLVKMPFSEILGTLAKMVF